MPTHSPGVSPGLWPLAVLLPLLLAACSEDEPASEPNGACELREHVRLAAPPAGWTLDDTSRYGLHVLGDLILYTFDDRDAPDRRYWRLDRCTGDTAPFPSLTPGLQSPYIVDTPAGRVLYANAGDTYYVVDRLDVPGDDKPRKIPGLPDDTGFLKFNFCNQVNQLPYACFWREGAIYTHTGQPGASALRVTGDTESWVPYPDALLVADKAGDLRLVDPLTGATELLIGGAQRLDILEGGPYTDPYPVLDPSASPADARVIYQPADQPTLYLRTLGDGHDVPLTDDPDLIAATIFIAPPGGNTVLFVDRDRRVILAARRADTGAAIVVPDHLGYGFDLDDALSLTLPAPGTLVQAIWDPETGSLHPWFRSPDPAPPLYAYNGDSVDYYQHETDDPPLGSLWRVDLATGDKIQIAPRVSPWMRLVSDQTYLIPFDNEPFLTNPRAPGTYNVEYLELASGKYTHIVDAAAAVDPLPGEGVVYLDARGPDPGVWATPLPNDAG